MRVLFYINMVLFIVSCSSSLTPTNSTQVLSRWSNIYSIDLCKNGDYNIYQSFKRNETTSISNNSILKQNGYYILNKDSNLLLTPQKEINCPKSILNSGFYLIYNDSIYSPLNTTLDLPFVEDKKDIMISCLTCQRVILELEPGFSYDVLKSNPIYENLDFSKCEITGFYKNDYLYLLINNVIICFSKTNNEQCITYIEKNRVSLVY
jgi:hypothetical protein